MDSDILAFSKRLFQTQTANCLNPSFSVFPCCMSYYVLCIEYCLVFYTHVYVVKPMGHGSVFLYGPVGHGSQTHCLVCMHDGYRISYQSSCSSRILHGSEILMVLKVSSR